MAEAARSRITAGHGGSPRHVIAFPAFANRRVRDALGYQPWSPPALVDAPPLRRAVPAPHGVWRRVALRALAMRRTPMGRLLYRMTPGP